MHFTTHKEKKKLESFLVTHQLIIAVRYERVERAAGNEQQRFIFSKESSQLIDF